MTTRKGLLLTILGLVLIMATGCRQGEVRIERERGSDVFTLTLNLLETEVETLVTEALAETAIPFHNPVVDLQPGQIVITGDYERPDGSVVNGRIATTPSVQDGSLQLQVTSVEIEGIAVSDARLAQLNERIAARIERRANRDNRRLTLESITVTADDMELIYTFTR